MNFQPFRRVVLAIYCSDCREEMPHDKWSSHYRTRKHREALRVARLSTPRTETSEP